MPEYREKGFDTLGGHVGKVVDVLEKYQFSTDLKKSEKKVVRVGEM